MSGYLATSRKYKLALAFFIGVSVTLFIDLLLINFSIISLLKIADVYFRLILSSWPAAVLILGLYVLTNHRDSLDHFIKNRMTKFGPGGIEGKVDIIDATEDELRRETIKEVTDEEKEERTKADDSVIIESHIPKSIPNTDKEHVIERFNKKIIIEGLVQSKLKEKYGSLYRPGVRIIKANKELIADGLLYTPKGSRSVIEIKYIPSKNFDSLPFIIHRKLSKLRYLGIKRMTVVVVAEGLTVEDALPSYKNNLHHSQIYF